MEMLLFWKHLDSSKLDLLQCSCVKTRPASSKLQQLPGILLFGGNFKSLFHLSNSQPLCYKQEAKDCYFWEAEYVCKEHFAQ